MQKNGKNKIFKIRLYNFIATNLPLRTSKDIDISLKKLILSKSKSITSIVDVGANHPLRMKIIKNKKLINFVNQVLKIETKARIK